MSIKNKLNILIESTQDDVAENELLEAVRKKIKESEKSDKKLEKEEDDEDGKDTIDGKAGDAVTIENPLDPEAQNDAKGEGDMSGRDDQKDKDNEAIERNRKVSESLQEFLDNSSIIGLFEGGERSATPGNKFADMGKINNMTANELADAHLHHSTKSLNSDKSGNNQKRHDQAVKAIEDTINDIHGKVALGHLKNATDSMFDSNFDPDKRDVHIGKMKKSMEISESLVEFLEKNNLIRLSEGGERSDKPENKFTDIGKISNMTADELADAHLHHASNSADIGMFGKSGKPGQTNNQKRHNQAVKAIEDAIVSIHGKGALNHLKNATNSMFAAKFDHSKRRIHINKMKKSMGLSESLAEFLDRKSSAALFEGGERSATPKFLDDSGKMSNMTADELADAHLHHSSKSSDISMHGRSAKPGQGNNQKRHEQAVKAIEDLVGDLHGKTALKHLKNATDSMFDAEFDADTHGMHVSKMKKAMSVSEAKTVDDDGDYDKDAGVFKSDKRENDAIEGKIGDVQKAKKKSQDIEREMQEFKELLSAEESLSEEFKEKAGVIFQAILSEKAKEVTAALMEEHDAKLASLEEDFKVKLEEATKEQEATLSEKIDGYFGNLSEEWINENELALEAGITAELTESFMTGLKTLFEEHYVNLPEDKRDLVEEIQIKLASTEKALAESLADSSDIKKKFELVKREQIIEETAKGMTDLDASRFKALMEDFDFETSEQYSKKSQIVKESFFSVKKSLTEGKKDVKKVEQVQIIEESILSAEEPSAMSMYVKTINGNK